MKEEMKYPGKVILTMEEYMGLIELINKAQQDSEMHLAAFVSVNDKLRKLEAEKEDDF